MSVADLESVTARLASASVDDEKEVSFLGQGLKLNNEKDADIVAQAISQCVNMTTLCLEGNTVGVDAAKAIAKALESQKYFRRALWKDMFTGRLKTEIPDALNFLSCGIMLAQAQLTELDLSDNAFGPVGIKGIVELLKSKSCQTIKILRLNNNGLGITGGQHLAQALQGNIDAHRNGPNKFALKTFICGRNRLENDGAKAIAAVLKDLGSLEELAMPQNGIYHEGISALADALSNNPHLKSINLNDNTFTELGAKAFAKNMGVLNELELINFGDCLLKTGGAEALAVSIKDSHVKLKEINLGFNEITQAGGIAIAEAMENKINLEKLDLNGNVFGPEGCEMIEGTMEAIGLLSQLIPLTQDEGEGDEDNEESEDDDEEGDVNESEEDSIRVVSSLDNTTESENIENLSTVSDKVVNIEDFLERPSITNFLLLGDDRVHLFKEKIGDNPSVEDLLEYFVHVSCTLSENSNESQKSAALQCCDEFLATAFGQSTTESSLTLLANSLLEHLGLIKSENKKIKSPSDLRGPLIALEHCVKQEYFTRPTKHTLQFFLSQPHKRLDTVGKVKHVLMQTLFTT